MIFWDMTIYNDTLNSSDITQICELITKLNFITDFDRWPYQILEVAIGAASQQSTLTPTDSWSCPIWDLHLFKCWDRSFLNLSCLWTFWFSIIPRYFYFPFKWLFLPATTHVVFPLHVGVLLNMNKISNGHIGSLGDVMVSWIDCFGKGDGYIQFVV